MKYKQTKYDVWFTSDTHFGHGNIIKYSKRPFLTEEEMEIIEQGTGPKATGEDYDKYRALRLSKDTVDKHDSMLIDNWNSCVKPGDRVYHLGDFAFGSDTFCHSILDRLNGQIHFIEGNHDKPAKRVKNRFTTYRKYDEIKLPDPDMKGGKRKLCLMHFPIASWHGVARGAYHLYGHVHGSLSSHKGTFSCDVGVDCWDYHPVSFEEIQALMAKKDPNGERGYFGKDHHLPRSNNG